MNCPGLGTSSILAGAIMAVLWSASGKAFDIDSLNHAVCIQLFIATILCSNCVLCSTSGLLTTCEVVWCITLVMSVCMSVCLSVCLSDDNFQNPWRRKFIFAHVVYLHELWVEFLYEGHQVKVKVTGAKKIKTLKKILFPQYKTSIGNNYRSVKYRAVMFVHSMGFWGTDRMV